MKIAKIWNKLAKPKNIPRLFAAILALVLLISIIIPTTLDVDQLYPRMEPQIQMDNHDSIAPYDRGGEILKEKGITKAEYPENSASIGWINSYMSPISDTIRSLSPYFGTSIYSSPGGLIDEILYYTRGFDTILESSILMMALPLLNAIARTANQKTNGSVYSFGFISSRAAGWFGAATSPSLVVIVTVFGSDAMFSERIFTAAKTAVNFSAVSALTVTP